MSAQPQTAERSEGLSSVKLSRGSGGRVDIEVKVYSLTNDPMDIDEATASAQRIFDRLRDTYPEGGSK